MVTVYRMDEAGKWRPMMPSQCPWGCDGEGCVVTAHSERDRKTGPVVALVVVKCKTHRRFFTLYPRGWVPYGRSPIVPIGAVDGANTDAVAEALPSGEPGSVAPVAWRPTAFGEALAAAVGDLWTVEPRAAGTSRKMWGRTQARQIAAAGQRLGLSEETRGAEIAAAELGVGLEVHSRERERFGSSRKRKVRGAAVERVVSSLVVDEGLLGRMLRTGASTRAWGRPWRVMANGGLDPVFRVGTRSRSAAMVAVPVHQ